MLDTSLEKTTAAFYTFEKTDFRTPSYEVLNDSLFQEGADGNLYYDSGNNHGSIKTQIHFS